MSKKAAESAAGPAAVVAIEQHFPHGVRLIDDELAVRLLPWSTKLLVWVTRFPWVRDWMVRLTEKRAPGVWAIFPCRKRYIEEKVSEAMAGNVDSVVNLGAGFATLAYRLPELRSRSVWEVDQPMNIDAKRSRLERALGEVPEHVTLVSLDFDQEDLATALASQGHPPEARTFFIWEAVTQYLTEAGIRATFEFLARASAGSRLVFTYVRQDFIEGAALHGLESLYERVVVRERIWLSGMNPEDVADILGGYGWRVLEHVGSAELAERYVAPTGRALALAPIEPLVYAEKV